jgi:DNA-directed RNA polymerase specialized sigma subunit
MKIIKPLVCGVKMEADRIGKMLEEISKKLSILIKLNLENKERSIREKVKLLSDFDLSNKDISMILDISEMHVSKEKSLLKKVKRK